MCTACQLCSPSSQCSYPLSLASVQLKISTASHEMGDCQLSIKLASVQLKISTASHEMGDCQLSIKKKEKKNS